MAGTSSNSESSRDGESTVLHGLLQLVERSQANRDGLIQCGSKLTEHDTTLKKHKESIKLVMKKTNDNWTVSDQRFEQIEANREIHWNTTLVLVKSLIYESEKKQWKKVEKLLRRVTQRQNNAAGERKKYTLRMKQQVLLKIQGIMDRDHVEATEAILKIVKIRKFAKIGRRTLSRWWGQKQRILDFLTLNPEKAHEYAMRGYNVDLID